MDAVIADAKTDDSDNRSCLTFDAMCEKRIYIYAFMIHKPFCSLVDTRSAVSVMVEQLLRKLFESDLDFMILQVTLCDFF